MVIDKIFSATVKDYSITEQDKIMGQQLKQIISFNDSLDISYPKEMYGMIVKYQVPQMELEEFNDPTSQSKTYNIHIKGQKYDGIDQLPMKDNELDQMHYREFKQFLEDYFYGRIDELEEMMK